MKKFFTYAMSLVMMLTVSFSTVSCSKDDVEKAFEYLNAGMEIYNLLNGGSQDVSGIFAGSAWAVAVDEGILVYSFETATTGKVILYDSAGENIEGQEDFTYTFEQYETEKYRFTISYSETEQWELVSLAEDNSEMTVSVDGANITLKQVKIE